MSNFDFLIEALDHPETGKFYDHATDNFKYVVMGHVVFEVSADLIESLSKLQLLSLDFNVWGRIFEALLGEGSNVQVS